MERKNQTKKRGIKKLKLYGKKEQKKLFLIASVFFNEKGELVVNSEYPEVKKELSKEIEWLSFSPTSNKPGILSHIFKKLSCLAILGDFLVNRVEFNKEKIEFYGRKLFSSQHIATIYVDEDKKVIIEAKDPKVKKDLFNAIYWRGKDEEPVFILRTIGPFEEEEKDQKEGVSRTWMKAQRPGDPDFLEALWEGIQRRQLTEKGLRKLGEYYLWDFKIIEE